MHSKWTHNISLNTHSDPEALFSVLSSKYTAFMETPKLQREREYDQGIHGAGIEDLLMAVNDDIIDLSLFQRGIKMVKFLLAVIVDVSWLSPLNLFSLTEDGNLKMTNCANTNVMHWNGRLFAECEGSAFFEFAFDPNTMVIDSVGFTNINASWEDYPFLAHSRVDRFNDDNLLVVGNDFAEKDNLLRVGMIDRDNNLLHKADVPLNHAQMVHDMSATEHFIIIFDFNLWFEIPYPVFRFVHDSESKSRIGVINKEDFAAGHGQVQWFEVESCIVFHMANAWEEGEEIVLVGPRQDKFVVSPI